MVEEDMVVAEDLAVKTISIFVGNIIANTF